MYLKVLIYIAYVTTHRVTGSFREIVLETKPVSSVGIENYCGERKGIGLVMYRYSRNAIQASILS